MNVISRNSNYGRANKRSCDCADANYTGLPSLIFHTDGVRRRHPRRYLLYTGSVYSFELTSHYSTYSQNQSSSVSATKSNVFARPADRTSLLSLLGKHTDWKGLEFRRTE